MEELTPLEKTLMWGKIGKREEKGATEDEDGWIITDSWTCV